MLINLIKNNEIVEIDKRLCIMDSCCGNNYILYLPFEIISILQTWEGFYIKEDKMYYKNHRIIVKEN